MTYMHADKLYITMLLFVIFYFLFFLDSLSLEVQIFILEVSSQIRYTLWATCSWSSELVVGLFVV